MGRTIMYYRKGELEVLFVLKFYFFTEETFFPENFCAEGVLRRIQKSKCLSVSHEFLIFLLKKLF